MKGEFVQKKHETERAQYCFVLCAMGLHCCPKTVKDTRRSHTLALSVVFLHDS